MKTLKSHEIQIKSPSLGWIYPKDLDAEFQFVASRTSFPLHLLLSAFTPA